MDEATGKIIGDLPDTKGIHGIAWAPELNKGFTSNGQANTVTVFDLKTLKPTGEIKVTGDCGGSWFLYRGDGWQLIANAMGKKAAEIEIPQEIAWRVFAKGISAEDVAKQVRSAGDKKLAGHFLNTVAIVA